MHRGKGTRACRQGGAVAIEFAIVLPIFLLLLYARSAKCLARAAAPRPAPCAAHVPHEATTHTGLCGAVAGAPGHASRAMRSACRHQMCPSGGHSLALPVPARG